MKRTTSNARRARLWFMKRFPGLYVRLSQAFNSLRWRDERRGWAGGVKAGPGGSPSVLFYSYYRCGSMFLSRALRELALAHGLHHLDYCSYFAKVRPDDGELLFDERSVAGAFQPEGCYFGTLRRAYPIPDRERYRAVLLLRDPRDCLVSHYFSIRESHTLNNRGNLEARAEALSMGVDEWVLKHMVEYREDFLDFHRELVGKAGVLFLRYEEMVADFPAFLGKVVEHTGLNSDRSMVDRIAAEADFEVAGEDVLSHKRSVQPGNHLRKLRPETVVELNEGLADVLEAYGYLTPGQVVD